MCNLYDIGPAANRNSAAWDRMVRDYLRQLPKEFAIRRTDPGLVLLSGDKGRSEDGVFLEVMRWGFKRPFSTAINNSRSDKLGSGMWNSAYQERRCLIPMAGFYEWTGETSNPKDSF